MIKKIAMFMWLGMGIYMVMSDQVSAGIGCLIMSKMLEWEVRAEDSTQQLKQKELK